MPPSLEMGMDSGREGVTITLVTMVMLLVPVDMTERWLVGDSTLRV